jgi:formylglycine-generating enzyme required for sulfatase activity
MRRAFLTFVSSFLWAGIVQAEHRAALLIANHAYEFADLKLTAPDLKVVVGRLEGHGFQCTITTNLDNNQLKREIEGFAGRTPVQGMALVYFIGQAWPGEYNKQKTICLLDTKSKPGRGLGVNYVLEQLQAKGGSSRNLVVLDTPKEAVPALDLPQVYHDESIFNSLGRASVAVSPPSKMIPGRKAGDEWVGPRGMVYCWCPPGKFTMGSPENESGRFADEAQRKMEITEGFWMAKYEWPRGLWRGNRNHKAIGKRKLHPVNMVSQSKDTLAREIKPMNEAAKKSGLLPPGWEFGLPSEAQWEYAARAGTTSTYFFGKDSSPINKYANFADKTWYETGEIYSNHAHRTLSDGHAQLAPVGSFLPNPWGLHDLTGNVAEWTDDAVMRGGSWVSTPQNCRSAHRQKMGDRDQRNYLGVRVVIRKTSTATPKPKK